MHIHAHVNPLPPPPALPSWSTLPTHPHALPLAPPAHAPPPSQLVHIHTLCPPPPAQLVHRQERLRQRVEADSDTAASALRTISAAIDDGLAGLRQRQEAAQVWGQGAGGLAGLRHRQEAAQVWGQGG